MLDLKYSGVAGTGNHCFNRTFSTLSSGTVNGGGSGGKNSRNFQYVVRTSAGSAMLFYCDCYGGVEMALGNFPNLRSAIITDFVRGLNRLSTGFESILRYEDSRKKGGTRGFAIKETLVDPIIMVAFKKGVLNLQQEIDSQSEK